MKTPIFALALAAAASLTIAFTLQASDKAPAKPAVTAWEHMGLPRSATLPFSDGEFARQINELGADGWELVSVLNFHTTGSTDKTVYYFKRPL